MRLFQALAAATCILATSTRAFSFSSGSNALDIHPPHEPLADGSPYPGTALYTNAVTYCAEAKAILIDKFDIAYWGYNNSVTFAFSFASVQPNLNVSASLYLNAYNIEVFNQTISLCDLVSGILCPLPMVNFTGYGTYPIGEDISDQIPSIAWTVPNIEAYARIELIDIQDGKPAACLQATLSNGWSTQRDSVKYATGFFTLAAGLIGLIHSIIVKSSSPAIYRWFDILYLFQTAATSGMMHLNYPLAFSNFVQNFGWALGLFYSKSMQHSVTKMRNKTGGKMSGDAFSQVQYINRKLSPYNVIGDLHSSFDMTQAIATPSNFSSFVAKLPRLPAPDSNTSSIVQRAQIPSLYEQTGAQELTTGLPVYVNSRGIAVANAFDTVFFIYLAFLAIVIAFHVILGAIIFFLSRGDKGGKVWRWANRMRHSWWDFCSANALRSCLIFFTPLFVLGFYQWTIGKKDSGLSIFFSILGMLMVFVPLLAMFILSLMVARRARNTRDVSPLYTDYHFYHAVGDALYRQYRQKYHFFWFAPLVLGMIAKSGFISFGHSNPWAQVIGCIVVEFIIFCCQLLLGPYKSRPPKKHWWTWRSQRFRLPVLLTLFRMILFGLCVAFLEDVGLKPIPRTVIGIVQIAVVGIPTVLLLIATIYNIGYGWLWRKNQNLVEDGAELESNDDGLQPMSSGTAIVNDRRSKLMSHVESNDHATYDDPWHTGTSRASYSDPDNASPTEPNGKPDPYSHDRNSYSESGIHIFTQTPSNRLSTDDAAYDAYADAAAGGGQAPFNPAGRTV